MAAADSSRFGDPRSGYAQHPPHPSLPHPYAHHHHHQQQQQHQSVVSAAAAVPAGIPQQSPAYPHPPQQQQQHSIPPHHHHQAPPPHPGPPTYGQLPPAAGATSQGGPHLDPSSVAAVPWVGGVKEALEGLGSQIQARTRTSFLAPSLRAFTTPAILRARRSSSLCDCASRSAQSNNPPLVRVCADRSVFPFSLSPSPSTHHHHHHHCTTRRPTPPHATNHHQPTLSLLKVLPGPAEAPMDSGGGGPSLVHPSYASMPQPHQHQQHQQHHPQHPHQQFYAQPPQHPSQHHHHQQHQHHPSSMGHATSAMGDPSGGSAMGAGAGGPPQSHQMLPPPNLAGGAGVYVPAPPPVTFPVEPQLDFTQILRLFNMTITASPLPSTAESINDQDPTSRGRKVANLPPSTWNSMLQSALDGLRSLDPMLAEKYVAAAREIQVPEVAEVVVDHVAGGGAAAGGPGGVNGAHHHGGGAPGVNGNGVVDGDEEGPEGKKRRQDDKGAEPQECLTCHAKSSPEWRRGPFGPRTLCNACGLVYIKIMKRRAKGLPDEEDENGGDGDDNDGSGSDD